MGDSFIESSSPLRGWVDSCLESSSPLRGCADSCIKSIRWVIAALRLVALFRVGLIAV